MALFEEGSLGSQVNVTHYDTCESYVTDIFMNMVHTIYSDGIKHERKR